MTIGKSATDPDHFHHRSLFYHAAREGFGDLLTHVLRTGRDRVLLPAFIGWSPREGSGVFDPVRASSARAVFYDLNPDLTVDLASLERALVAQPGGLLVFRANPAAHACHPSAGGSASRHIDRGSGPRFLFLGDRRRRRPLGGRRPLLLAQDAATR